MEQNVIIGYLLIGTDNTAHKLIEAEQMRLDQRLRDQQFYTRSLIESNIDAIITTDPAGIITDVNKQMEALTDCSRDELIGAPFKKFFTDPDQAAAVINLVLLGSKISDYELTVRARDGKETVVSYNASTFYDRDRKLQGVFAAARDVTERKRLDFVLQEKNEELERALLTSEKASLAKSEFLSNMSHEIRTPMNGVVGMVDILQQTKLDPMQNRMSDTINKSALALLAILNDILDYSKIEAGKLAMERISTHLREVAEGLPYAMQGEAARCRARGMDGYISKPLRMVELAPMLQKWLPLATERLQALLVNTPLTQIPVWNENCLQDMVGHNPVMHRRLLDTFLVNARMQVAVIALSIDAGEFSAAADVSHALKSGARMLGALRFGDLWEKIEMAGHAGDEENCCLLSKNLAQEFSQAQGCITQHLASLAT